MSDRRANAFVYRGRTEIIASVLEGAREGRGKTELMYLSRLDFRGLNKYLGYLLATGFLEREDRARVAYRTTAKGLEFLDAYRTIASFSRD